MHLSKGTSTLLSFLSSGNSSNAWPIRPPKAQQALDHARVNHVLNEHSKCAVGDHHTHAVLVNVQATQLVLQLQLPHTLHVDHWASTTNMQSDTHTSKVQGSRAQGFIH